ncbi:MAG: response regulator receiver protein [Verrucomicrobiales bacterium]|nr:response regulator receiver protein [Verrucomicrobiales bacterium]
MRLGYFAMLIVDDCEDDCRLIERALLKNGLTGPLRFVDSGNEAIAYFKGDGKYAHRKEFPYPSIVITGLKMSPGDGFSVLAYLKAHPEWAVIPVLMFSNSDDLDDIKRAYCLGASCYARKPSKPAELERFLGLFYDFWVECEVPQIDVNGKRTRTSSEGKLGARFTQDVLAPISI